MEMVIFQSFPAYIVKIWNDPIETSISKRVEFGAPGSSSKNNQNPGVVVSIFSSWPGAYWILGFCT